jgi:Tol biopolymer transport system component
MKKHFLFLFAGITLGASLQAQPLPEPDDRAESLTPRSEYFMRPSWSPNGKYLAFTSRNHHGIWTLNFDSRKITKLVDGEGAGYKFAWSPDGQYIAYRGHISENRRKKYTIEIIDTQTTDVQLLTDPEKFLGTPRWSAGNSLLFFTQKQELMQVETNLPTSIDLRKLVPASERFVAFTSYQKLHIAPLQDTLDKELRLPEENVINPSLSPDGNQIVYEEVAGDLIVLDLQTGKRKSLGSGHRPAWSPDGIWICYMVTEDDGHQYISSEIYIASPDGKQKVNLLKTKDLLEMNPAWSPDGNSIVFDEHLSGVISLQKLLFH